MELTKETLHIWLESHKAISPRLLSLEAGLNESYINQLYNKSNKNLTPAATAKLLPVLQKYGWG
jgi:hypothetical protein